MKTVVTPLAYGARMFTEVDPEFGVTPWFGACHIAVNEIAEANVTQIIVFPGHALERWFESVISELRALGVKCVTWTKVANGHRRTVRTPIPENCSAGDVAYFAALVALDRGRVP